MDADLLLLNGRVYTLAPERPHATALALRGGKIAYVGNDDAARELPGWSPRAGTVDLHGATVIPGLMDAHMHFQSFALGLQQVNAETDTLPQALARVAQRADAVSGDEWILGFGWNHNAWGGEFPTASQLDGVSPINPVCLRAKSGHAMWVNTATLRRARITAETPDAPGGRIVRDALGQPTGILLEEAMSLVDCLIPQPTHETIVAAMRQAMVVANRAGLTGVHDMDGPSAFSAEQVLHSRGELSLRVTKSIPYDRLEEALALGLRSGLGDDWLRLGQVKIFTDGALGPRTAWMIEGYDSAPEETGISVADPDLVRQGVSRANAAGLACAIHAIGDRAVRTAIDIYASVAPEGARQRVRNRIEHVQLLHPADEGRLARHGIIASMQPIHATSDMLMADRHWGRRCAGAYALRTMLRHGAALALGSDCPVEAIDPLVGIHAAVTRRRLDGSPGPEGWHPEQRLTAEEAVRGFSWGPAYAAGMEDRLGALREGYLADMTILEQDILSIDPMDIPHVRVLGTVVGGHFAWRDESL
jgi:predicted amidohydrolase YtcJ